VPRTLLSVATAAATVTIMFAIFFFIVANIFVIIVRRRFRQFDALPPPFLPNQLKRTK
jgi:uncharacterized membrane protein YoaK (UPF0700 family)